jgi:hypothetical protein
MENHVTVIGILYIAFSALMLLLAIIVFTAVVGGGIISGDSEAMAITAIVGPAVASLFLLLSAPGLIGGIYLLKHRPWARILVLVLGFLNLIRASTQSGCCLRMKALSFSRRRCQRNRYLEQEPEI